MEAKKHTFEKPTNHRINQKWNQNMDRNKGKHDKPKLMGFSKSSALRRFIATQAYLKKQEKNK